jgi:hypothetical protein
MFDDEKPIRYHLTEDYELDPGDRVFADRLKTGTTDWERRLEITDHAKSPKTLQSVLRNIALKEGGEAWRAMTDRGELLRLFSVCDLADELSGRKTITLSDDDQYHLGVAEGWLDLPPPF